jgi:phosphoribosylaminoimidazole carboxylase (NCAIR synthetase)
MTKKSTPHDQFENHLQHIDIDLDTAETWLQAPAVCQNQLP